MAASLVLLTRELLGDSTGLPEPHYDEHGEVTNWPSEFVMRLRALIRALNGSADTAALADVSTLLEESPPECASEAVLRILARALYDNPSAPVRLEFPRFR
jgi:hypothetical protein